MQRLALYLAVLALASGCEQGSQVEAPELTERERNKAVVASYMEGLGGSAVGQEYLASDYELIRSEFHNLSYNAAGSELADAADAVNIAIADRNNEIIELIGEDSTVVVQYQIQGTHDGNLFGIPATGNPVDVEAVAIFELENGKIDDAWFMSDEVGLLNQLGTIMPTRADGKIIVPPANVATRSGDEILADALANPVDSQEYRNKLKVNAYKAKNAPDGMYPVKDNNRPYNKYTRRGFMHLADFAKEPAKSQYPMSGAFPDRVDMISTLVADGDKVVIRFLLTATNTQSLFGIPATNAPVGGWEVGIMTFNGDDWDLGWWFGDDHGMLSQLGGTPDYFTHEESPDTILFNGKIVTVDNFFSIQEAVAIQGERITAVGSDKDIQALAGPDTRLVDLEGRTVIPGLIDNHNHVIRVTEYWPNEARLDGVTSRAEALAILKAKAESLPEGVWLMALGGWVENQFKGDRSDFTLAELDEIAPDRPAFIQSTYDHAFGNTAWLNEMDIPLQVDGAAAATGLASYVVRDDSGSATGRLNGGMTMVVAAIARFPKVSTESQENSIREAFAYFNSIGLTAAYDPAGNGIKPESYERLWALKEEEGLSLRVFHTFARGTVPSTLGEAEGFVEEIRAAKPFQGDNMLDMISVGENYYIPFHRDDLPGPITPTAEAIANGRSILMAAAEGGWSVQTHIVNPSTIDMFLDVVEEVNEVFPMRQLRWTITHADRIERPQVDRMRHLGMNIQIRSISTIHQPRRVAIIEELGEPALHIPALRMLQDSGAAWGLGTDGTKASQINPFVTLWWAVTGLALNGETVLVETLTREEALIAHTRSNAYLMFQENNIGSIRPGLLADMLILDRDYLTVPESEIREIRPIAVIMGGVVVSGDLAFGDDHQL